MKPFGVDSVYKLGKRHLVLKFKTDKLLKMFGLPLPEQFDDPSGYEPAWPSTDNVVSYLGLDRDTEGNPVDRKGTLVTSEVIDELKTASADADRWGTVANAVKRIYAALDATLSTFMVYRYEYAPLTDTGERLVSGEAEGIIKTVINPRTGTTTIVANDDLIHIINHIIAGVGEFYATDDFEGETANHFAETRFSWLKHHWRVYGERPPQVDLVNVEDFDRAHFATEVRALEKQHGLSLLSSYQRKYLVRRKR